MKCRLFEPSFKIKYPKHSAFMQLSLHPICIFTSIHNMSIHFLNMSKYRRQFRVYCCSDHAEEVNICWGKYRLHFHCNCEDFQCSTSSLWSSLWNLVIMLTRYLGLLNIKCFHSPEIVWELNSEKFLPNVAKTLPKDCRNTHCIRWSNCTEVNERGKKMHNKQKLQRCSWILLSEARVDFPCYLAMGLMSRPLL